MEFKCFILLNKGGLVSAALHLWPVLYLLLLKPPRLLYYMVTSPPKFPTLTCCYLAHVMQYIQRVYRGLIIVKHKSCLSM